MFPSAFPNPQVTVVPLRPGRAAGALRDPSRVPEGAPGLCAPAVLQRLPLDEGEASVGVGLQLVGRGRSTKGRQFGTFSSSLKINAFAS